MLSASLGAKLITWSANLIRFPPRIHFYTHLAATRQLTFAISQRIQCYCIKVHDQQLQAIQSASAAYVPRPKEFKPCTVQPHPPVVQSELSPDLHHAAGLSPLSKTLSPQSAYVTLTLWKWNMLPRQTAPEPMNGVHPVPPSGLYLDWWRKASGSVCYVEQPWSAPFLNYLL